MRFEFRPSEFGYSVFYMEKAGNSVVEIGIVDECPHACNTFRHRCCVCAKNNQDRMRCSICAVDDYA